MPGLNPGPCQLTRRSSPDQQNELYPNQHVYSLQLRVQSVLSLISATRGVPKVHCTDSVSKPPPPIASRPQRHKSEPAAILFCLHGRARLRGRLNLGSSQACRVPRTGLAGTAGCGRERPPSWPSSATRSTGRQLLGAGWHGLRGCVGNTRSQASGHSSASRRRSPLSYGRDFAAGRRVGTG